VIDHTFIVVIYVIIGERTTMFMVGSWVDGCISRSTWRPETGCREMDLAHIGAHCSLASCHELDLLPIRCRCDKQFCKNHIFPDAHQCPVDPSQALRDASPTLQKLQRCAFASCNKPSLDAFVGDSAGEGGRTSSLCPRCKLGYCAS
jgi:AN1-like Zinc finger